VNFTLSSCTTFCNVTEFENYLSQMCKSVMKQLSGWNINGVFQKSSGAKIYNIEDNDFKIHMASDILFIQKPILKFNIYCLFYFILCRSICLSLSISNSFPVYVHAVFHFVPPLEIHNLYFGKHDKGDKSYKFMLQVANFHR
jgi:hypothetical protein